MEVCHRWQRRIIKVWNRADLRRFNVLPGGATLKEGHGMFSVRSKDGLKAKQTKACFYGKAEHLMIKYGK